MLVILGVVPVTRTVGRGEFVCPECGVLRPYAHQRVQQRFAVFFVSVLPLDELGEYIECQHCDGTFRTAALEVEAPGALMMSAEFRPAVLRVMLLMMLEDGRVQESEKRMIQDLYHRLTGRPLQRASLDEHLEAVVAARKSAVDYAGEVAPLLNEVGKELVLKAAFSVAVADGRIHPSERSLLERIGRALAMSPTHIRGVMADSLAFAADLLGEDPDQESGEEGPEDHAR
jgi:tellurite resistance protein